MERIPIQQLPQSLVNRIAAGEVIERPASVVKELVDNAIDAGASQIIVEIEDGGRELVRVIDDGCGIPPEELQLAFAPHATSKLKNDDDLFKIQTMGFRGEALASIGSVSHSRILSRTKSSNAAYEIINRGGELSDIQAAAGNVGTTIEVRNLFFNTPARRKFLKGTQTELGHITDMVLRLSLAQPHIAFKVIHNGRVVREYHAGPSIARLLTAWPDDYREQRLPLETRDAEITLTGVIGLPELASPTAKYQHLYINGRPIRDKFIQHALKEAYRGLTEPGRQPAAILLINMPPEDVDVNVHPTKSEVRFKDSGRIHGLVMSGIREVLLANDLTPRALPRAMESSVEPVRMDLKEKLAEFFRAPPSSSPPSNTLGEDWGEGRGLSASYSPRSNSSSYASLPPMPRITRDPFELRSQQIQPAMEYQSSSDASVINTAHPSPLPAYQERELEPSPERVKAIQVHNSYLVVESDEGMLVIDQHALHERIIYEELLAKITAGPLESQQMLIPHTVRASTRQIDLLEQIRPLLSKLGIDAAPFGPDAVAIQAFPSFLDRLDPGVFVTELLEKGEQELLDLTEEELLHEVLDMMSCKAAVKAGDPLTPAEIEALLARRELVERSSNCPHGRPTTLRLSLGDLEKQFKRTGF